MRCKCNIPSLDELIIRAFEDGAKWADKHPKETNRHWINVEDELPCEVKDLGISEEVLISTANGCCDVACYNHMKNCWYGTMFNTDEIVWWAEIDTPEKGGKK